MTTEEYYIAPDQDIFEDIKKNSIELWKTYDDTYGYATNKINAIKDIENISDNCAYIVAMFDYINQEKLFTSVKNEKTKEWIKKILCDR